MLASIFLSHASEDKDFVRKLAQDLRQAGARVWLDEAELLIGDSLVDKIGQAISEVDYVAVVLSQASVVSDWVKREVEIAINHEIHGRKVKVLPILKEECEIPEFLKGKLYADMTELKNYEIELTKIKRRLNTEPKSATQENHTNFSQRSIGRSTNKPPAGVDTAGARKAPKLGVIIGLFSAIISIFVFFTGIISLDQLLIYTGFKQQSPKYSNEILSRWVQNHQEITDRYGYPRDKGITTNVWEQIYEKGRIVYNNTSGWAIIFDGNKKTYNRIPLPGAMITGGNSNTSINHAFVNELLAEIPSGSIREIYRKHVNERNLVGGIGTIYLKNKLYPVLGNPIASEFSTEHIFLVKNEHYELLVGLANRLDTDGVKAVFWLSPDINFPNGGRYEKHTDWKTGTIVDTKAPAIAASSGEANVKIAEDNYYAGIEGLRGEELQNKLYAVINGHKAYTYDQIWDNLRYTDEDPDNPANIILFYTGWSIDKDNRPNGILTWNREHIWPKFYGDFGTKKPAGTDLHNIRPIDTRVNSARNTRYFDVGGDELVVSGRRTGCYFDEDSWEPRDAVKGDVARMIFYMAVRYQAFSLYGKRLTLLDWHREDPVDQRERDRNDRIYELQGNRNPFIDHPDLAMLIWESRDTFRLQNK